MVSNNSNLALNQAQSLTDKILQQLNSVILGKNEQNKIALTCLLANGHLLIEDLPGCGKTTQAHALAITLGLDFKRIQFTSDLLPSDILGVSIYEKNLNEFCFHQGPIFSQLVLADEVNRATPKTQSSLLEAMEERQVSSEGKTLALPKPFFVIATQNPSQQIGTFELPESQLDRFLLRISLGYPNKDAERRLFKGESGRDKLQTLSPVTNPQQLIALQQASKTVHLADAIIDYLQDLVAYTRNSNLFVAGLSTRACLGLIDAVKSFAMIQGREFVIIEDVQTLFPYLVAHRLEPISELINSEYIGKSIIEAISVD
ncbi:MAG: AAA family ATPase [Gammaproteobacteria bacterium]|nr:MAG: AAA family ATPase [Gammaproteobacteria bacterium]